jgi:ATP:corrinoid adenosyltransferase
LQSAIGSHFHKLLSEEEVDQVLKALIRAGHVVVTGKKVTYRDRN